jgi:hypothetical protein
MTYQFSTSSLIVVNGVCPVDADVLGPDDARIVVGELPDAVEFTLTFEAMCVLARTFNTTLASMAELRGRCPERVTSR